MSIGHLLVDTVTYATWSSDNHSGDPTWGSQSTAAARIEYGTRKMTDDAGVERDTEAVIITETDIPDKARIWLPDDDTDDGNAARKIMKRKKASTPSSGLTLYELYL